MTRDDLLKYLQPFVADLERQGSLHSQWIKDALSAVPRHLFIDECDSPDEPGHFAPLGREHPTDAHLSRIYSDIGIWITFGDPPVRTAASQPQVLVGMLEDLQVGRGNKVLEIGTGSGWNAGLLAFGVGDDRLVHSIDIQAELVEAACAHLRAAGFENVNLRAADGGHGWLEAAPFDRIIVTASSGDIPPAWIEQLADGGVLVLPLKTAGIGDPVLRLRKDGQRVAGQFTRWCYFVPLVGAFLNGEQEGLLPPWEPFIEELCRREPTKVPIAESVDRDCVFFAYLTTGLVRGTQPLRVRPGPLPGSYAADLAVFDPQSRSICVALSEEPAVEVYGDLGGAERLAITQQEWIALGRPKITDYKVELVDPARAAEEHGVWIDRRPHATLKFSLPTR